MKGFNGSPAITPITPQSSTPRMPEPRTGCLSLQCRPSGRRGPPAFGQGVVALQGGPVASKGGSSPAQGAYAHMSAPPEGEGPPLRGGMAGMWAGPVAGKSISLRPPHPGTCSPLRGPGGIYRTGPGAACPSRPPRPPFWGRVYGGIKVELAPGAVGGEWGLAGWLGGWGREPLV